MKPEQHHEDCDYRNSHAAKEAAEILKVDVAENSEVFDCNLGCEDNAPETAESLAKKIVKAYTECPVWKDGKSTDEVRTSYDPIHFDRGYSETDNEALSGFISGEADEHGFQYWRERAYDRLDEWVQDCISHDAGELVEQNRADIEAAGLDEHDVSEEIRFALYEAMTQDYAAEWVRDMAPPHVRVCVDSFGEGDPVFMGGEGFEAYGPSDLLTEAGLVETEKNLAAAQSIINEAWHSDGYYNLWLVFRMDTSDVPDTPADTVRIEGECELWMGNPYAGDGMAETVEVDITIERSKLATDENAGGYSYDVVFGPHWPSVGQPKLTFTQSKVTTAEKSSA